MQLYIDLLHLLDLLDWELGHLGGRCWPNLGTLRLVGIELLHRYVFILGERLCLLRFERALEVSCTALVDGPAEVAIADDACVSGHLWWRGILELSDVISELIEEALESLEAFLQLLDSLSLVLDQLSILVTCLLNHPLELSICHFLPLLHLLLELLQLFGDLFVHGVDLSDQVFHGRVILVKVFHVVLRLYFLAC